MAKKQKVVLAYSGGLDTSVAVKWLAEKYNMDVIALCVDVGGVADVEGIRKKALKLGAIKSIAFDAREEFVNEYVTRAIKANALYEGQYPLATALGRPLMAKWLVDIAHKEGATTVAHGCTGKGNDQVRFDCGIFSLGPELKIIAPARDWGMTREETIDYAQKHKIPVPVKKSKPYSIDENPWGRAIECGVLEDPWTEPPADIYEWTKSPDKAPAKAEYVEIGFEKGLPVSLNGSKMKLLTLIDKLNVIAGRNGIGRIDHIESRLVGIKSRENYEAPAAMVIIQAHIALEYLTMTRNQLRFKDMVAREYSDLVYNGLWFSGHREDLDAYINSSQRFVTGSVRLKLHKGSCIVVGRKSPYSLYSYKLATYDKGDIFDQGDSAPFIRLWGLQTKIQAQEQMVRPAKTPARKKSTKK
ncbi:MAG: argininosuccinate synthase [Dehalococcoidia bacterium]|nr:argininosuccinate synthase [Dehalococcoidia bacterium]